MSTLLKNQPNRPTIIRYQDVKGYVLNSPAKLQTLSSQTFSGLYSFKSNHEYSILML